MRKENPPATRRRPRPPTHVYVPATFDPKLHLPPGLQAYADSARYFLHRIVWGRVQRRLTLDRYVPVKFDYLRAVIPDRVIKPVKQALIDHAVVESDGRYVEGEKSLGYRLRAPHDKARIVRTPLTDGRTAEKVRANRQAEFKRVRLDIHRHLRDHYRRLEIDLPLALRLLAGDPDFEVNKIPPQQIDSKDFSFSVCRYGRVHTDLTRCPKAVRPALRVGGEPLVEIDVANSQPLFLVLLVINYRKRGNKSFGYVTFPKGRANPYDQIDEIINNTIRHFAEREEDPPPRPSPSITTRTRCECAAEDIGPESLMSGDHDTKTIETYKKFLKPDELYFLKLCEAGRLYDEFKDRLEVRARSLVKKEFFGLIYGANGTPSPLKADFDEIFPHVAQVVRVLKRKDHAFLPRLMQNVESTFVINNVCRRLMTGLPQATVFTIHDCLLTTPAYEDAVVRAFREEFARLGLSPTLHVRRFGRDVPFE